MYSQVAEANIYKGMINYVHEIINELQRLCKRVTKHGQ